MWSLSPCSTALLNYHCSDKRAGRSIYLCSASNKRVGAKRHISRGGAHRAGPPSTGTLPPCIESLTSFGNGSKYSIQLRQGHHGYVCRNNTVFWLAKDLCLQIDTYGPERLFSLDISFGTPAGSCSILEWQQWWLEHRKFAHSVEDLQQMLATAEAKSQRARTITARMFLREFQFGGLSSVSRSRRLASSIYVGSYCGVDVKIQHSKHKPGTAASFVRAPADAPELLQIEKLLRYKPKLQLYGECDCKWCGAVRLADLVGQ